MESDYRILLTLHGASWNLIYIPRMSISSEKAGMLMILLVTIVWPKRRHLAVANMDFSHSSFPTLFTISFYSLKWTSYMDLNNNLDPIWILHRFVYWQIWIGSEMNCFHDIRAEVMPLKVFIICCSIVAYSLMSSLPQFMSTCFSVNLYFRYIEVLFSLNDRYREVDMQIYIKKR